MWRIHRSKRFPSIWWIERLYWRDQQTGQWISDEVVNLLFSSGKNNVNRSTVFFGDSFPFEMVIAVND